MSDDSVERAIGRIEGKLEGVLATLHRVDQRSQARDETLQEMSGRLGTLEEHAERMTKVAEHVTGLQQFVRDGKMQGKGVLLGFGLATAAGGATLAAFFKSIMTSIFG